LQHLTRARVSIQDNALGGSDENPVKSLFQEDVVHHGFLLVAAVFLLKMEEDSDEKGCQDEQKRLPYQTDGNGSYNRGKDWQKRMGSYDSTKRVDLNPLPQQTLTII
jgi:hypothetical protein